MFQFEKEITSTAEDSNMEFVKLSRKVNVIRFKKTLKLRFHILHFGINILRLLFWKKKIEVYYVKKKNGKCQ